MITQLVVYKAIIISKTVFETVISIIVLNWGDRFK